MCHCGPSPHYVPRLDAGTQCVPRLVLDASAGWIEIGASGQWDCAGSTTPLAHIVAPTARVLRHWHSHDTHAQLARRSGWRAADQHSLALSGQQPPVRCVCVCVCVSVRVHVRACVRACAAAHQSTALAKDPALHRTGISRPSKGPFPVHASAARIIRRRPMRTSPETPHNSEETSLPCPHERRQVWTGGVDWGSWISVA